MDNVRADLGPCGFLWLSDLQIGLLAMSFMIAFIPLSIPVSWVIDTYDSRLAVSIGAVLMGIFGLCADLLVQTILSFYGAPLGSQPRSRPAQRVDEGPANWFAIEDAPRLDWSRFQIWSGRAWHGAHANSHRNNFHSNGSIDLWRDCGFLCKSCLYCL